MYGRVVGPASAEQQQVLEEIHRSYDMQQHGRGAGTQESAVTGEFARNFGIFGSPSYLTKFFMPFPSSSCIAIPPLDKSSKL
jgi:hypothetical protein